MDIRYEGVGNDPNLELTDELKLIKSKSTYMGSLSTLLVWHIIDPVSEEERIRNNEVYRYQKIEIHSLTTQVGLMRFGSIL